MNKVLVAARGQHRHVRFVTCLAVLLAAFQGTASAAPIVEEVARLPGFPAFTVSGSGSGASVSGGQFMMANDGYHGLELWFTDGTQAGTRMVKDLNPGTGLSQPRGFVVLNDMLYFIADVNADRQVWVSDGTEAGTRPVVDLRTGASDLVQELVVFNGALYFHAVGDAGTGIYTSDGMAAGTSLVVEVSYAGIMTPSENYLYYWSNNNPSNNGSLYRTDGTAGNSVRLTGDAMIVWGNSFAVVDGWLYFTTNDNTSIAGDAGGVYRTDGTAEGTALITGTIDASSSSSMYMGAAVGNKYVFAGRLKTTAAGNLELFVSDGTAAGTMLLKEIRAGDAAGFPLNLTSAGAIVYFLATDDGFGHDLLWRTDGTPAGTYQLSGTYAGAFAVSGTRVYFRSHDGTHGSEPWVSEGTLATTQVLKDIWLGANGSMGNDSIYGFGSGVMFTADDGTGRALWISDGSEENTIKIATGLGISQGYLQKTGLPAEAGEKTYFSGNGLPYYQELWVSDGTGPGTHLVADINPGSANDNGIVQGVGALGDGRFVFLGNDGVTGNELWVTDGSAAGTSRLVDANPGTANFGVGTSIALDGKLLMSAYEPANGIELWVTDGTSGGTQLLKDINPGSGNSAIEQFTVAGDKVFFFATDSVGGRELWMTDGTATARVKDIVPDAGNGIPSGARMIALGSRVLFQASTADEGSEPWISDGTETGTQLLVDLVSGTSSSGPGGFVVAGERAFFVAQNQQRLWVTDGTTEGTAQVGDLAVSANSIVGSLNNDLVFVSANRLYRTDGTVAGTFPLSQEGLRVLWPKVANDRVIFVGDADPVGTDAELWASDGVTVDGATRIKEFTAGTRNPFFSFPNNVTVVPNGIVFGVDDADDGTGVYFSDGTAAGTQRLAVNGDDDYQFLTASAGDQVLALTRDEQGGAVWKLTFNAAPVVDTEIPDGDGTQNEAFNYDVSGHFSDVEGDAIAFSASGLPDGLAINSTTGVISGVLTNDAAMASPVSVTVTATDAGGGSVSTTFDLVVANVNDTPAPVDDSVVTDEDTVIVIDVLANDSDPDGDTLVVTEIIQPLGFLGEVEILSGGASLSVTPFPDSTAPMEFSYRISDGELDTVADVTVTITPVNDAPRFTNPAILTAITDEPYGYVANVFDPEGDIATVSATTLPAWLSFDAVTGELTGTAELAELGDHGVLLVASDGVAQSELAFTLTVIEPTDAGLSVTLAPLADSMLNGEDIGWTATVANAGPADANAPVLVVRVDHDGVEGIVWPAACTPLDYANGDKAECTLTPIAAGESASLAFTAGSSVIEDVFVLADASSERVDPETADNIAGASINVTGAFAGGPARVIGSDIASSVALGDLDGDGDTDLVVGTVAGKATAVYLNDGSGVYMRSGSLGDSVLTQGIALADIDDDGDLDILLANNGANAVYRNDGGATFTSAASLGTNDSRAVATGDFDADGDIDVAYADDNASGSELYTNNGAGAFTLALTLGSTRARDIAIADLNGDGDPDVALAQHATAATWFAGASGFTFGSGTSFGTAGGAALAAGPLDDDAGPGLVLAHVLSGDVTPVASAYRGTATLAKLADFGRAGSSDALTLDLDGDDIFDVLTVGINGNHRVHLGDGNGGFAMHDVLIAAAGSAGAAAGDVDGDGDTDLLFANAAGGVDLYLNGGGGNIGVHRADLGITATLDTVNPSAGSTINWTLRIANDGPDGVRSATVNVSGTSGLNITAVTGEGVCSADGAAWRCTLPVLAHGAAATVLTVQATADAGTHTLSVSVAAATNDPAGANNDTTSGVTVSASGGSGGGGGGGGATGWLTLLLGIAVWRTRLGAFRRK